MRCGVVGCAAAPVAVGPYDISVEAMALSAYAVSLRVRTSIPLPVEVMASLSIKDQKPAVTFIGVSQRVTLTSSWQVVRLDGAGEGLPAGNYDAAVTFYPRWGARSGPEAAKAITEDICGQADVTLAGSGASKAETDRKNAAQMWVMENVISGTPWDPGRFVAKLGAFTSSDSDLNHHDAYYFADADMTIIVSRIKKSVAIWRRGRATKSGAALFGSALFCTLIYWLKVLAFRM